MSEESENIESQSKIAEDAKKASYSALGKSIVKLTVNEAKALGDYLEKLHGIESTAVTSAESPNPIQSIEEFTANQASAVIAKRLADRYELMHEILKYNGIVNGLEPETFLDALWVTRRQKPALPQSQDNATDPETDDITSAPNSNFQDEQRNIKPEQTERLTEEVEDEDEEIPNEEATNDDDEPVATKPRTPIQIRGIQKNPSLQSSYMPNRNMVRAIGHLSRVTNLDSMFELNESATIDQWIETRLRGHQSAKTPILPVFSLVPEKQTSVALVIDSSIGMELWADITETWRKTIQNCGYFRTVRDFILETDYQEPRLRHSGNAKHVGRVGDGSSPIFGTDEVVLVISHVSSPAWQNGNAYRLLGEWSKEANVAILSLLPERHWRRSSLDDHGRTFLEKQHTHKPWVDQFTKQPSSDHVRLIPVASLRNFYSLEAICLVMGQNRFPVFSKGIRVQIRQEQGEFESLEDVTPRAKDRSADRRVQDFLNMASNEGIILARMFANCQSHNLKWLRALGEELRSKQNCLAGLNFDRDHEAEILLLGILKMKEDSENKLHFDFHDGVRPLLQKIRLSKYTNLDQIEAEVLAEIERKLIPQLGGDIFKPDKFGFLRKEFYKEIDPNNSIAQRNQLIHQLKNDNLLVANNSYFETSTQETIQDLNTIESVKDVWLSNYHMMKSFNSQTNYSHNLKNDTDQIEVNSTDRSRMIELLNSLTEMDLRAFIFKYYSPAHQPSSNHDKQNIVINLVSWAESLRGPKLSKVRSDLDKFLGRRGNPNHRQPMPQPAPIPPAENLKEQFDAALIKDDLTEGFQIFDSFVKTLKDMAQKDGQKILNQNQAANIGYLNEKRTGIINSDDYRKKKAIIYSNLQEFMHEQGLNKKPNNLKYHSFGESFVGRGTFLNDIRSAFKDSRKLLPGRSQWQVIIGLAGVGKSRSAVEYGWRFAGDYSALLFVRGHDLSRLIGDLADLAGPKCLNLELDPAMPTEDKTERVLDHLRKNPGWLLIIDEVDDEKTAKRIHQFLENLSGGDILITSRWRDWNDHQFQKHELELLDIDSATEFILLAAHKRPKQQSDRDDARQLAQDLDQLSLALHQAVGYINSTSGVTIAEYRRLWKEKRKVLASHIRPGIYNTDERDELMTILTTWQTSFSKLSKSARWLMNHLALLAPSPVPISLAEALHSLDPNPKKIDRNQTGSAEMELRNYSLLESPNTTEEGIGQIHRLVQMVLRQELPHEQQAATWLNAAAALKQAFSGDPLDHTNWPRLNPLADHVAALLEPFAAECIEQTPAEQLDPQGDLAFLGNNCGLLLYGQARYAAAMPMYWLALAIDEKSFGPEHPNVARGLNNLAGLLRATNRLDEAEPMFRRALAIYEKSFGPDHPYAARGLNNLAGLLRATNRLAAAEPMYRRALAIGEKSFGPEHPNVARGLNNLAALLRATNRLDEAEPMFRRAAVIVIRSLGLGHPNALTVVANYLDLLSEQGNKPEQIRTKIKTLCNETNTNLQELFRLLELKLNQSQTTGTDENSKGTNS